MAQEPAASRNRLSTLREHEREFETISELIGRIYECAVDPTLWDDTLTAVSTALGPPDWDVFMLMWERLNPPGCRFVGATHLIPMAREIYSQMFAGRGPWSRRLWTLPTGRVVDTDEIMPRSEILESDFYKNFVSAWNMQVAVGVVIDRQGPEKLALIIPGPPDRDLDILKRGLRLLVPHMQRAIRISSALGEANLRAAAAESALEIAPTAVVTLTPALKMMNQNAKATELIQNGWARETGGVFTFSDREAQRHLVQLANAAPPSSLAFRAKGPDGRELAVLGARMKTQTANTLEGSIEGAGIILTIGLSRGAPLIEINRLAAWFGLTAAEARLAAALASGTALEEYARLRSVSMNAVRYLLKCIYRKTLAKSQAQLVAQIRDLPLGV